MVCLVCWGSASGQVQSPKLVELTYDVGPGVVGELIDFTDGKYRLKTSVGVITVNGGGVLCKGAACPKKEASPGLNETIKLTSLDGTMVVSGRLVFGAGDVYVVSTSIGVVEIDVDLVKCEGEGCAP